MAFSVKHAFISAKADDPDITTVRPSNWNADHTLTMTTNKLLGRATAADGAVEEITLGTNLSFTGTTLNAAGSGNVSNSGTPTVGQYGKWVTATSIEGVPAATVLSDLGAAPLASPTFTGDPKAPTPTLGDNDTSVATTAFVTAAIAAIPGGTPIVIEPQGRLTLQSGVAVMTTAQSAKTAIFYTPYVGNLLPIYNGTLMVMTAFTERTVATTDTTKSPAAIGASKVNDWFIWSDAGTIRIGHGPDWTSDTVRSAGTALVAVNGIMLNNVSITNGPAAQRGTYVGTTRSNASSQLDWILGSQATGGAQAALLNVWNCYNRVVVATTAVESVASWTYGTNANRPSNNSTGNRISFVSGLAEDGISASFLQYVATSGTLSDSPFVGLGMDTITAVDKTAAFFNGVGSGGVASTGTAVINYAPALGAHFIQAMERASSGTSTFYGAGNFALNATLRM